MNFSKPSHDSFEAGTNHGLWRMLSLAGVAVALVAAVYQSPPSSPLDSRHLVCVGLIFGATLIVLALVFRPACRALFATPDLLVPIGCVMLAGTMLEFLMSLPMLAHILRPGKTIPLFGVTVTLSVGLAIQMVIATAYAAWQTDLLWRRAHEDPVLDLSPWGPVRRHFLRTFVALAVGVCALFAGVIVAVGLSASTMVFGLVAMAILGLGWNLLTAALLPVTMYSAEDLVPALREGMRQSWQRMGRWWLPLLAQLALLGFAVYIRTQFHPTDRGPGVHTQTNIKWQINAFWTGGYEHTCRWYTVYADALDMPPHPVIVQLLMLLFLVVAVAMKWTVIRELIRPTEPPAAEETEILPGKDVA